MLNRLIDFVTKKKLFSNSEKILLAVSGGIDSMVMLHLFDRAGFNFAVVHCNFQLRGFESDADEKFVSEYCATHGIIFFNRKFDTTEYAGMNGISIEMAARELRYRYFEEVRTLNQFDFIATAHHQDDLIETFFLNLTRKSGIRGLSGMDEKTGYLIRPMLFTSRSEIEEYASLNEVNYREDSSNREQVYQRNFIRHTLLPQFEMLNPAARKNILQSISYLKEAQNVYESYLTPRIGKILKSAEKFEVIPINELLNIEFPELILYEILSIFGFTSAVSSEVFSGLGSGSGKQYFSATHRVIKDRDRLLITPREKSSSGPYYIEEGDLELFYPFRISVENYANQEFRIPSDASVACLDKNLLEFPLMIRRWEPGDYFQPLGLKGIKKVSDFLIDEKVSIPEKENTWLVISGRKIAWIIGRRIDERFRITAETRSIYLLKISQ